jgi:hypothetical protein
MKPSTLQRLIFEIPQRCFSHAAILRDAASPDLFRSFFGIAVGYGMKRVCRNLRDFAQQGYLQYLVQIEDGLYDNREELREDRLETLHGLPLPPRVQGFADVPHYRALAAAALAPAIVRLGLARLFKRA